MVGRPQRGGGGGGAATGTPLGGWPHPLRGLHVARWWWLARWAAVRIAGSRNATTPPTVRRPALPCQICSEADQRQKPGYISTDYNMMPSWRREAPALSRRSAAGPLPQALHYCRQVVADCHGCSTYISLHPAWIHILHWQVYCQRITAHIYKHDPYLAQVAKIIGHVLAR